MFHYHIQDNNHQLINKENLTHFTEAGGIYPEFDYKQNIYDIEKSMTKTGYDCKINAKN